MAAPIRPDGLVNSPKRRPTLPNRPVGITPFTGNQPVSRPTDPRAPTNFTGGPSVGASGPGVDLNQFAPQAAVPAATEAVQFTGQPLNAVAGPNVGTTPSVGPNVGTTPTISGGPAPGVTPQIGISPVAGTKPVAPSVGDQPPVPPVGALDPVGQGSGIQPTGAQGFDQAPVPDQAGAGGLPQFGRDDNLINTQINPLTGERLGETQGLADEALRGVASGPDRLGLAEEAFGRFADVRGERFEKDLRRTGQRAAALGRIGSGVTTSEIGDLETVRQRDLLREEGRLRDEAVGQQLDDRLKSLGAITGAEERQFGQGVVGREELRGEREFQRGQDESATDRRVQQRLLEEQLLGNEEGRRLDRDRLAADIGFRNQDPAINQARAQELAAQGLKQDAQGNIVDALGNIVSTGIDIAGRLGAFGGGK